MATCLPSMRKVLPFASSKLSSLVVGKTKQQQQKNHTHTHTASMWGLRVENSVGTDSNLNTEASASTLNFQIFKQLKKFNETEII